MHNQIQGEMCVCKVKHALPPFLETKQLPRMMKASPPPGKKKLLGDSSRDFFFNIPVGGLLTFDPGRLTIKFVKKTCQVFVSLSKGG